MEFVLNKVVRELAEAEGGLSYWEIYKALKKKHDGDIVKSHVRYYLENLREKGLVEKNGTKYSLKGPVAAYDGVILFSRPPSLLNCPFHPKCDEEGCLNRECKFYKESPEEFKRFLDVVLSD